jgi:predicted HTH transcriptional regulator
MTTGSFARGALIELTDADLLRMLELDESLFVEHKSDIGEDSQYQIAKAVSAFANTLGGWLLIGVHEGSRLEANHGGQPAIPRLWLTRSATV